MTEFDSHRTGSALPGEATPITAPGEEPETRNFDDSTSEAERARTILRRRLLIGLGGMAAAIATLAWFQGKNDFSQINNMQATADEAKRRNSPTPEKPPIPIELTSLYKYQHCKPETLNAPTFEGVAGNVFNGLQYGMAANDQAILKQLIPGPPAGDLLPDQLMFRASFYEILRRAGPITDYSNPHSDRYRCDVASIVSYEGLEWSDAATPFDSTIFKLKVQMTIQEALPLADNSLPLRGEYERCKPFPTTLTFSRYGGLLNASTRDRQEFPDITGEGRGWALLNATSWAPISDNILAQDIRRPPEFPENPPIWANHSYIPK